METDLHQIIEDGHIARRLLRDFVIDPDSFDDDAIEEIWMHLDECEDCMEDYDRIKEGDKAVERATDDGKPEVPVEAVTKEVSIELDDLEQNGFTMPVPGEASSQPGETPEDAEDAEVIDCDLDISSASDELTPQSDAADEVSNTFPDPPEESCEVIPDLPEESSEMSSDPPEESCEVIPDYPEESCETSSDPPEESCEVIPGYPEESCETSSDPPEESNETIPDLPEESVEKSVPEQKPEPPSPPVDPDQQVSPDLQRKSQPADSTPARNARRPVRPAMRVKNTTAPRSTKNIIIALVFIIVVLASATVLLLARGDGKQENNPVAGWAPLDVIETRVPLQEIPLRRLRGGRVAKAEGTDVELNFRGIKELVIAADLDFLSGNAVSYELIVRDRANASVFQEEIPGLYIDDGRLFLKLVPKQFSEDQVYTLQLVAHQKNGTARVTAESVFQVVK